jgi:hypothetical protein
MYFLMLTRFDLILLTKSFKMNNQILFCEYFIQFN